MKKVLEVAAEPFSLRRKFWQENLSPAEQVEWAEYTGDQEKLKKEWKEVFKKAHGCLFSESYAAFLPGILSSLPRRILEVHKVDTIMTDHRGNWWPFCLQRDALHELVTHRVPNLDTHARAYVTGSGPEMRVALALVVQLGFRTVYIVMEDPVHQEALAEELQRLYFDIQIRLTRNSDLTLQKNNGSILINTFRLDEKPEYIYDLSYLNFILVGGVVVDTSTFPLKNQLLAEAAHVSLQVIHGAEISGLADWLFLHKLNGQVSINKTEYCKRWVAFLQQLENQKNPVESPVTK